MNKKVKILVEPGQNYDESVKNGAEFTSVSCNAINYGGSSPCDNPDQITSSIKHYKEWIKREGDIPVLIDKREDLRKWY